LVAFHRALKEGGREEGMKGGSFEEGEKAEEKKGRGEDGREGRVETVIRELIALATGKMLIDPPGRKGGREGGREGKRADNGARPRGNNLHPAYACLLPFPPLPSFNPSFLQALLSSFMPATGLRTTLPTSSSLAT